MDRVVEFSIADVFYLEKSCISRRKLENTNEFVKLTECGSEYVHSLRRQIARYVEWFVDIAGTKGFNQLEGLADEILKPLTEWSPDEAHGTGLM